jgi:hypothetical protein
VTCRDDTDAGSLEAVEKAEEALARNREGIADTDCTKGVGDVATDGPGRLGRLACLWLGIQRLWLGLRLRLGLRRLSLGLSLGLRRLSLGLSLGLRRWWPRLGLWLSVGLWLSFGL